MYLQLKLLIKEKYLPILLIILLFLNINILSYNHIVLGKETDSDDDNNRDSSREEDVIIEKDFEDISINELFDNNNDDNNRDSSREEDVIIEKDEEEDDVPFILPFNAVPFP